LAKKLVEAQLSKKYVTYVRSHPDEYPDADSFLHSLDQWPEKAVRANAQVQSIEELCEVWDFEIDNVPWCKDASYFDFAKKLGSTKEHSQGLCYVGDPSAMLAIECLEIPTNAFVVDMCAAPGGKSVHVLNSLGTMGTLVSNDVDQKRMRILKENLGRMLSPFDESQKPNVEITNLKAEDLSEAFAGQADVVVLDAPCSGEAMMRRSNTARHQWSEKLVLKMSILQKVLLAHAKVHLKPNGKIVYSTCTFNSIENEGVMEFGRDSLGLTVESGASLLEKLTLRNSGDFVPVIEREFGVALYPHLARGDGQFVGVFKNG